MIKFVGNMHGDEAVGRQIIYYLAHHLLTSYERYHCDKTIKTLNSNLMVDPNG